MWYFGGDFVGCYKGRNAIPMGVDLQVGSYEALQTDSQDIAHDKPEHGFVRLWMKGLMWLKWMMV